ncbi:hypothetical protein VCV18_002717 [Metarhizium anisopliae]
MAKRKQDGDGVARQAHEAEEAKGHEEKDAGVGHTPGRGPQENLGRLLLDGQAVQHTGAGQETLVGGRPGRGDDDGVDDGGDGGNAGGRGGNDKGALGGVAALPVQAAVLAGHEHADNENGQHVEQHDADKDVLAGGGDGLARVPVAEEPAPVAGGNVLDKGARVAPVPEVDGRRAPDAAEVDDEAEDDEEDDEEDLEDGKDELDLAEEADKREAHDQGQQDKGDDPDGGVDVGPELEEHADGGDFRGDGQDVAVDEVPADGEAPGRVDEELGVPHKGAGDGEQRGDLAQGELDGADDEADGGIAEQRAERTAALHGAAQAQEQAPLGAVAVHDGCVVAPGAFDAGKEALEGHGKVRLATGNQAPRFQRRGETAETAFPTTCPARRDEEWIGSRGTQGPRMGVAQASKGRTLLLCDVSLALSTLSTFDRMV